MISLISSFIILFFFVTNSAAQTSPLEQFLKQQSQGLPFGTDLQSLENRLSGQGFDINPENAARAAKQPLIPNEQNVKVLDRRLAAEEAQQRAQEGQALTNELLGGQSKAPALSMVETYYRVLTGEKLDVFGTGKSVALNNIAINPADARPSRFTVGLFQLARLRLPPSHRRCSCHLNPRIKQYG